MRAYYGRGLNYYNKPLTPAELYKAALQNENRKALNGETGFDSVRECIICGCPTVVKGATNRGTIWRRCSGVTTHDDFDR